MTDQRFFFSVLLLAGTLATVSPATDPSHQNNPDPSRNESVGAKNPVSDRLDRALVMAWKEAGLSHSPQSSDDEFLRRAAFDILGRPLASEERDSFFKLPQGTRRALFCEKLVEHRDADKYLRDWWKDSIQNVEDNSGARDITSADLLKGNKFLKTLLDSSARGEALSGQDGMVEGFSDYLPATKIFSSLALGTSLQCAQCHDHFLEPHTQEEFWQLNSLLRNIPSSRPLSAKYKLLNVSEQEAGQWIRPEQSLPLFNVRPEDSSTKKLSSASAHFLEDPRFARAVVNQIWSRFFGRGFNSPSPVREINDPSHKIHFPEALNVLTEAFKHSQFNQKELMKWICESDV